MRSCLLRRKLPAVGSPSHRKNLRPFRSPHGLQNAEDPPSGGSPSVRGWSLRETATNTPHYPIGDRATTPIVSMKGAVWHRTTSPPDAPVESDASGDVAHFYTGDWHFSTSVYTCRPR